MKNKTRIPVMVLLTLVLAACSGVMDSAQAAKQYYMLVPYTGSGSSTAPSTGPELSITVSAVPGLDTDRILALSGDARLNPYANARWPDNLPEVLASVLKRSLAASGRFAVVEESDRADADDWLLQLEVQQFYGVQNAPGSTSSVAIELSGTIECSGQRGSFILSDSNSVAEERLSAVVAAHQQGLDDITRQLLARFNETCP